MSLRRPFFFLLEDSFPLLPLEAGHFVDQFLLGVVLGRVLGLDGIVELVELFLALVGKDDGKASFGGEYIICNHTFTRI